LIPATILIPLTSLVVVTAALWWFKYKKPFVVADLVFQAKNQQVSFHYPLTWTLKIKNDVGYVFGPDKSSIRLWFGLNNGFVSTCETTLGPIEIISTEPVSLSGLGQPLRYIEAVLPASTKPGKYVVYFGLAPDQPPFDQPQTFTGCLGDVKSPIFVPGSTSKTIIEFHSLMYANQFDAFTFTSKASALDFFQSSAYQQAKQVILSVQFG